MRKLKRRKIIKEFLEERIAKNARRIQRISAESFQLRLQLEAVNATPVQQPLTKAGREELEKAKEQAIIDAAVASEPVMDSADQEIGTMPVEEEKSDAVS